MAYVCCDINYCKHYKDGGCGKDHIFIETKTTGEFRSGHLLSYPVCQDYEETEDARD